MHTIMDYYQVLKNRIVEITHQGEDKEVVISLYSNTIVRLIGKEEIMKI